MKKYLMMLMAAVSVFVMTGCTEAPNKVVSKWGAAIIAGDKAAASEAVVNTEASKEMNEFFLKSFKEGNEETQGKFKAAVEKIGEAKINGDTAEVEMVFSKNDKATLVLKKVDGKWKIDFEASMKRK